VCFQSEKMLLYDQVKQDLEDKIRRLEEDRHNIDITSGNVNDFFYFLAKQDAVTQIRSITV